MDALTLRDTVIAALGAIDAEITHREPRTGPDGRVDPTVVVGVTAGTASGRRAAGGSVNRDGTVTALVVSTSRDSCLSLVEQTRDILADLTPGAPHGRLTDVSYDAEPLPEPDTAPARWSQALAFTITRKRGH